MEAEGKRLNKYLSECGYCSRRKADEFIERGRITINGNVAKLGDKVMPGDKVMAGNKEVNSDDELVLLAFNKPRGITCTAYRGDENNIMDYINYGKKLQYIGRLDKNSEGLLLLTNDGDISNAISKSRNEHEKEYIVTVDMTDASQEIKSEEDVLLLKVTASFPDVTIDGSAAAADNINDFYAKEKESFDAAVKENETFAKEDYAARSKEEQANFFNYEMMQSYTAKRTDDACISIISDTYQMTGGAHGNAVRTGATFDTASGQQLTFKDVFTDVDKAKEFINQYLLEEFKTDKYKDMLFEDYEKDVPTILDDNTWYLSDEGFVVICNEYIVSPHSSGIMEVTIPYADFTEFSDTYKSAAK